MRACVCVYVLVDVIECGLVFIELLQESLREISDPQLISAHGKEVEVTTSA